MYIRCVNGVPGACRWARWVWTAQLALQIRLAITNHRHTRGLQWSGNHPRRSSGSRTSGSLVVCRLPDRLVGQLAGPRVAQEASHPAVMVPTCPWTVLVIVIVYLLFFVINIDSYPYMHVYIIYVIHKVYLFNQLRIFALSIKKKKN